VKDEKLLKGFDRFGIIDRSFRSFVGLCEVCKKLNPVSS